MNSHYSDFINANFDSSDFIEDDVTQEEIDAEMERVQRELEEERDLAFLASQPAWMD